MVDVAPLSDPPPAKTQKIEIIGYSQKSRMEKMWKSIAKSATMANAAYVIDGFKFTYSKEDDVKVIRTQGESMLKTADEKPVYRTFKMGKRSVVECKLFVELDEKKAAKLKQKKRGTDTKTFDVYLDVNNPGMLVQLAIGKAIMQHFLSAAEEGPVKGHGWLEKIVKIEADPTPEEPNRTRVSLILRLVRDED